MNSGAPQLKKHGKTTKKYMKNQTVSPANNPPTPSSMDKSIQSVRFAGITTQFTDKSVHLRNIERNVRDR